MLGVAYNTEAAREFAAKVARAMRDEAYLASIDLAKERGAFPALDVERYLASGFARRLPKEVRHAIREHGIRNSHLLSIAPTGTISLAFADNASNGIEPAFSWSYFRKKRQPDGGWQEYQVVDHAYRLYGHLGYDTGDLPRAFVTALQMKALDHLLMVKAVQPYIDAAISKTVNVPEDYPFEDFQELYMQAWNSGLKGIATYRPNSVRGAVLSVESQATPLAKTPVAADSDPLTKSLGGRPEGALDGSTAKVEYWTMEGRKAVYVTVNYMRVAGVLEGKPIEIERPVEFFMPAGQRDDGQQWISANMRLLSMHARSGGSVAKALENMREVVWDKGTVRCGTFTKADGTKVPRHHESEVAALGYAMQQMLFERGFLDSEGKQIPLERLVKQTVGMPASVTNEVERDPVGPVALGAGRPCDACGAHAVHRRDGCLQCDACGTVGSCS